MNISHTRTSPPTEEQGEQAKRLETLKLRKEMERQQRERAVWREASSPPTVFGIADATQGRNAGAECPAQEDDRGIFTKLKHGKFLHK